MADEDWQYCSFCRRLEPVEDGLLLPHRMVGTGLYKTPGGTGAEAYTACTGSGQKPSAHPGPETKPMSAPCKCGWTGGGLAHHFPHSTEEDNCD